MEIDLSLQEKKEGKAEAFPSFVENTSGLLQCRVATDG